VKEAAVQALWDLLWRRLYPIYMLRRNRVSQHLLGSLTISSGESCLELGGPTRRWQEAAERFGAKTIVLNIDMNHLIRFRTLYHSPVFVVLGDATRIPLKDKSVDYVISYALLEHITVERRFHFAQEIMRVARKGYYIATPYYWFPFEPHYWMPFFQFVPEFFKRWLTQKVRVGMIYKESYEPIALATKRELRRLFPQANITGFSFTGVVPETIVAWWRSN